MLREEVSHLEAKVTFTEKEMLSLANEKNASWLESMLTYCR